MSPGTEKKGPGLRAVVVLKSPLCPLEQLVLIFLRRRRRKLSGCIPGTKIMPMAFHVKSQDLVKSNNSKFPY
jgi:hypothetical protein